MGTVCGISLNKIGIIVGTVYLIQAFLRSILLILNLIKYTRDKKSAAESNIPFDQDKEIDSILSTSLSISLTFVITSPLLIWGSVKKKHLFLTPWLYNSLFCIICNGLYLFSMILKLFVNQQRTDLRTEVSPIQFCILILAFAIQIVLYRLIKKQQTILIIEQQLRNMETSSTICIVYEENEETR